ncbi:DUF3188 domain-containing protein [Vagococcus intermedius]|uniref:DUF3188 domain-containing protein n=1 Tax=Vagococcus intermedius TaxID=2991418 RepID=A0AAF0CVI9_9ENTE|nr:DUF3188 domain-containing protein [Vagococcus intermedius]WEG73773.1 DUF3188 domain-containing protein [Vagococcus intermedius]WEG75858.1 DUF3188 domain-containing protein [Vagococcus intermedius]
MNKGGLFLCSIGLLIIMFSANQNTGTYNILNLITGSTLLIVGVILYVRANKSQKKNKKSKKKEVR